MKQKINYLKLFTKLCALSVLTVSTFYFSTSATFAGFDIFEYNQCIQNADSSYSTCVASCAALPPASQSSCMSNCGNTYTTSVFNCRSQAGPYHRSYARCTEVAANIFNLCMQGTLGDCTEFKINHREGCCGQIRLDEFNACYYP